MILLAAEKHRIDLAASWMIGDADRDIVMAQRAGVGRTMRIMTDKALGVDADFTVADLGRHWRFSTGFTKRVSPLARGCP